jgi:hypothetical protein
MAVLNVECKRNYNENLDFGFFIYAELQRLCAK